MNIVNGPMLLQSQHSNMWHLIKVAKNKFENMPILTKAISHVRVQVLTSQVQVQVIGLSQSQVLSIPSLTGGTCTPLLNGACGFPS